MRASLVGGGARAALSAGGEGAVVAWFPRACYVSMPGGLVSLAAPGVRAGPIHVVLDEALPPVDRATRAGARDGCLTIGRRSIDLAGAEEWRGPMPSAVDVRAHAHRIKDATNEARRSALHAEQYRARTALARELLAVGRLEDAAQILVGMGPGLTPSGDDALAGVLFTLRVAGGPPVEPLTRRLAEIGVTGEIPRAFLRWAARGQALAPVHELFVAAAADDVEEASRAARDIVTLGETSGADLLLGLEWGVDAARQRFDPFSAQRRR